MVQKLYKPIHLLFLSKSVAQLTYIILQMDRIVGFVLLNSRFKLTKQVDGCRFKFFSECSMNDYSSFSSSYMLPVNPMLSTFSTLHRSIEWNQMSIPKCLMEMETKKSCMSWSESRNE